MMNQITKERRDWTQGVPAAQRAHHRCRHLCAAWCLGISTCGDGKHTSQTAWFLDLTSWCRCFRNIGISRCALSRHPNQHPIHLKQWVVEEMWLAMSCIWLLHQDQLSIESNGGSCIQLHPKTTATTMSCGIILEILESLALAYGWCPLCTFNLLKGLKRLYIDHEAARHFWLPTSTFLH